MKRLITMVIMVLAVAVAMAQAPEKFTYQAVVRNTNNALVTNTLVGVRVSILQGSATGSGVYVETQMPSTNANGLITLNIGDGNAIFGTFGSIDWSAGPYFLKTEIDPNGGNNYSVTSTQQLLSVPYALYAKEAGNSFSGDYNDLTNTPAIPTVPTNVSAFTNDAGYITGYTETDPTVPAWAKEANKPTYNYSEIVNTPTIPTVPTNVSAFTNDAGYITSQDIPAIPTVPTNVSAFTNDAGYITGYTETDPTVPAWAKEANKPAYDYTEIANTPAIPTVPTNVSAFTNDAGYLTDYTETDPTISAWAKEANKPTYDYTEITNTPVIPTVPTNVSAFTNDAGYLTSYTETDPQFNAWDKSYNDLINTPTNVSAFANDAQYITAEAIPTQVSAFTNDAEYITIAAVPTQVSAFENDALYITEGELQQTVNVINNTFDSVDNTIDSLRNRIDELEGHHTPPTVMTTGVADVAYLSATVNGSVVYIGGAPVAAKGFCYDTVMHPTVESNMVNCGSGSGSFSTNLLNLKSSTTYFVRAYATNMWGTNYGDELSFTTLVEHAPSVEILPASEISYTSFVCSGDVTDSGTYSVTARGFCWSTDPDPVMTGEHLHVGNGSGTFSALLANMQPETTFYVRAYAVNAAGVTYSTSITVSTLSPTIPTVSTDTVNGYNECTGTVLADGNAPVTQRGFCYDTLPSPTLENGVVIADGSGLGEFTATLTGLPVGKLYFVRAFATNAKGTAYGNQIHFHASSCDTKTLTDYDGNVYNTVAIGTQCWMKENLKTTHYSDGWPIEWRNWEWSDDVPYYYYPNQNIDNVAEYGLLYNWPAVMRDSPASDSSPSGVQGICPSGWHVPSNAEWTAMTDYVANHLEYTCEGFIAKAFADSIGWLASNISCSPGNDLSTNNSTGFSARPAGQTESDYREFGQRAWFWSASIESYFHHQIARLIHYTETDVHNTGTWGVNGQNPHSAFSVRCLRDY
ncbi:MAG: fibrobacter succinogenes major paralogous domain-containing protein [Bacteroidales bacterium]|nr:fibrobacter succinogenes major paralogous domain-containing protein [Bacteroidales bacterium]